MPPCLARSAAFAAEAVQCSILLPPGRLGFISKRPISEGRNRRRSILFDDDFVAKQEYRSLKPVPPAVETAKRPSGRKTPRPSAKHDKRGGEGPVVTDLYDSLKCSRIRQCALTGAMLPKDFLVCFRPLDQPDDSHATVDPIERIFSSSKSTRWIVPDRIQHPRFAIKKGGRGKWVLCRRDTVKDLLRNKRHLQLFKGTKIPQDIVEQVEAQLQQRVVQEAELLALRMRILPWGKRSAAAGSEASHGASSGAALDRFGSLKELEEAHGAPGDGSAVQAILDLNARDIDSAVDEKSQTPSPSERISAESLSLLRKIGTRPVPLYPMTSILPPDSFATLQDHLRSIELSDRRYLGRSEDRVRGDWLAVYSSAALHARGTGISTLPLLTALYRLRLWTGQGWTIDGEGVRAGPGGDEEVLPGFRVIQDVMHTRI